MQNYHPEAEAQRRHRQALNYFLPLMAACAQGVARFRGKSQEAAERLKELTEANHELTQTSFSQSTGYWFLVLFLLAVFLIDCLLFGPTAEYFARRSFSESGWVIPVARLVIPGGFLLVEVAIAIQLYFARQDAAKYSDSRDYLLWTALGLLFAVVMPSQVLATLLASQPAVASPRLALAFTSQLIGLVILTLIAHVAVLFGGRPAHEAKVFLSFRLQQAFLSYSRRRFADQYERKLAEFEAAAQLYFQLLNEWNAKFLPRIEPGSFDRDTQELLKDRFGKEALHPLPEDEESPIEPTTAMAKFDETPTVILRGAVSMSVEGRP